MDKIKIQFVGGYNTPTGSNFLLTYKNKKILIDCGLFQGEKVVSDNNYHDFPYNPADIDYVFVTHGHLDHVGRIPKLLKEGFKGLIYSTEPTRDIAELIMLDSLNIINKEAERYGRLPFFEEGDVLKSMSHWKTLKYREDFIIDIGEGENIKVRLFDSGHILGSAIIRFEIKNTKIAWTGDLGNTPSPLLNDTENLDDVDYLVLESVYGDRNHEDKMESVNRFKSIIMKAIKDNGVILVPAFSIERTQELLFYIHDMVLRGEMPKIPIYLDSPLAIKITSIYRKYFKYLNTKSKDFILNGEDIFNFPNLYQTLNKEESKAIANIHGCKMIIAGSGMSTGGRIIHHEKSYLGLKTTNLILVGYQSIGSLGRLLQEGIKNIKIQNQDIIVRAHIESIGGFSAHKDSKHLVQYVKDNSNNLKKVFVVLGEPKSEIFLAQRIREYVGVEALTQKENEIIEIEV